jgi:hypothetical protein
MEELDARTQRAAGVNVTQPAPVATANPKSSDPLAGLRGRDRVRALSELTHAMSAAEREEYQNAMRLHRVSMTFDMDSKLTQEARAVVLQVLASMAEAPVVTDHKSTTTEPRVDSKGRRKLTVFELARLKRDIQIATSSTAAAELLRQVAWSIEAGALRRFSPQHALHIALKKIREEAWTRPHRMPPNWSPELSAPAVTEPCRAA